MEHLTIRHSSLEDGEAILALIEDMEHCKLSTDKFRQIYEAQLGDDNFLCLVGEAGGEVVACINLRMEWQLHHTARICEIMEFSVRSDYRSKGVGKRMFDKACEEAERADCVQIEVACNQLRQRTHMFYERMGMHNFHYKFSLNFSTGANCENQLGR